MRLKQIVYVNQSDIIIHILCQENKHSRKGIVFITATFEKFVVLVHISWTKKHCSNKGMIAQARIQGLEQTQIIWVCPDIWVFSVLHYRHLSHICAICQKCKFEVGRAVKECSFSQRLRICIVYKQTLPYCFVKCMVLLQNQVFSASVNWRLGPHEDQTAEMVLIWSSFYTKVLNFLWRGCLLTAAGWGWLIRNTIESNTINVCAILKCD